ncbi:MAG: glycosyltransferase family 2 protein, partial [Cyanobacteria bacterium]|nr:glycosyltransferase family 2 protein [Cyanobacteriota bacterium]
MPVFFLGLAAALLATLVLQLLLTLAFALVVHHRLAHRPQLGLPAPTAEVVLCLRGVDPSLTAALAALAAQTYPGPWRLLVVVDSLKDPAWPMAEKQIASLEAAGLARWQGTRLMPLAGMPACGSLKSASLRQAFGALHGATELVALVDADAVVAPGWLEALAAGGAQAGVGAVSGNRWYAPAQGSPAGMVRKIWNGGALVLMTLLGIPWGGSLAVRRQLIESTGWRDVLATSLCEDTALPDPLARRGWRYQFRPELIAIDRDDGITLR